MRIQHNIMAMSAYRNYNNNTSALSKNLEKLSSGYKINRAGDDAAGLAISEKMRAQITGLTAASKNVKDGISLVKTAEGAMQEIQDMLNRMDYLATQSANGTYQDEVDREALQKEVDQLRTEINRIADSANFNGIKLLDGSLDAESTSAAADTAADKATQAAQAVADAEKALEDFKAAGPETATPVFGDSMSAEDVKAIMLPQEGTSASSAANVGTNTILETDKIEFQAPSFQVNMDGVTYTMATDGTADDNGIDFDGEGLKLTIGTQNFTLTEEDMQTYLVNEKGMDAADVKAGTTLTGEDLANAIAYKINNAGTLTGATTNGNATADPPTAGIIAGSTTDNLFGDGTNAWKVRADGQNVVFEFDEDVNVRPTTSQNKYYDTKVEMDGTPTAADVKATAGTTTYTVTDGVADDTNASTGNTSVSLKATINGKEVDFGTKADVAADATAANIKSAVDALAAAEGTDADGNTYKFSDYFTVSINGQNIVFTDTTKGAEGSGNTVDLSIDTDGVTLGSGGTNSPAKAELGAAATAEGTDAYTVGLNGYINAGTEVVIPGLPAESEQLASTTLNLSGVEIADGTKITLGNESYIFAVGKDSAYKNLSQDGVKVVDLTDVEDVDMLKTVADGGDQDTRDLALSRLTEAAKDNDVFSVSHETNGSGSVPVDQIGLKQLQSAKEDTDMTTMDNFASYIDIQTVDSEATAAEQEIKDAEFDAKVAELEQAVEDAKAAQAEADTSAGEAADKVGKPLNLQIGDTSDDFNQMKVKIGNMHTAAMGTMVKNDAGEFTGTEEGQSIADIDISNVDGAQKAIDVIKDAINYVSSVRGDLGAYQNRLEHTANNLAVMTENITDAESTIRDTDIAEEMMSYTKNNILVQSAQAMLAQANAVPQGVLQLLG